MPDQVEIDIIVRNGELMLCELKLSVSKSDIDTFERTGSADSSVLPVRGRMRRLFRRRKSLKMKRSGNRVFASRAENGQEAHCSASPKVQHYQRRHGRTASRRIVISPMVRPEARPVAERLGIEVFGSADEVTGL